MMRRVISDFPVVSKEMHLGLQHASDLRKNEKKRAKDSEK